VKKLYKTVWEISQKTIIKMAADRGAFIDQSQSLNLHFAEPDKNKLNSAHFYAWKMVSRLTIMWCTLCVLLWVVFLFTLMWQSVVSVCDVLCMLLRRHGFWKLEVNDTTLITVVNIKHFNCIILIFHINLEASHSFVFVKSRMLISFRNFIW